jgi:hypothetical protein
MPQGWVLAWAVLTLTAAGCATGEPARHVSWLERFYPFRGAAAADMVLVDTALIERPIGDPFIDKELWLLLDEQAIPFERKSVLEENGFRVGQVVGTTPAGLQALLTSDKANSNARRLTLHSGKSTLVAMGPARASGAFRMDRGREKETVSFERAQFQFDVIPTLTAEGAVRLQFTPQVQHGRAVLIPGVAEDRSGWALKEQRPTETSSALQFDVTLAANQYVVIGGYCEQTESFGYQTFVRDDEPAPVQRLLVIRACPAGRVPAGESRDDRPEKYQSLASRAAYSVASGE